MIHKNRPTRSKKYIDFVRTLPSCISGKLGCVAHHVISCGLGGTMGGKASDLHTIPLTPSEHADLHKSITEWEAEHGPQALHVLRTQVKAEAAGVLGV